MEAMKTKLSDMRLSLEDLEAPAIPNPYQILLQHIDTIRHNLILKINKHNIIITNNNYLEPHPLSISYVLLVLIYSYYSISKILGQIIDDFLTIPYHLLCDPSEILYIYYQDTMINNKIMKELQSFIKYTQTFWHKSALT